ncbi:hypothetical protein AGMMS49992_27070 [Clostridia bacterium]|nr:hypothetical protein AGMMS49992_27070 [Clostridia bacterium]
MKHPGQIIRERRAALGLTAQELANRIGVTAATITRYETGEIKSIKYDRLIPLANALGVTTADLLGLPEYVEPEPDDYERMCAVMRELHVLLDDGSVNFNRLAKIELVVKASESLARE